MFICALSSHIVCGVVISAAAVGVAALVSATKSAIVKSVSCPTAAIIGILQSNIALATSSVLYAHRSSIDPPPLPIIITSAGVVCSSYIAFTISIGASFPWTIVGRK